MLDDLFVPDPPVGDSSNRIPNTRFVTVALASAVASVGLPSIGGLNLLANSSTGTAVPTGLTASNYIDSAIGSTQGSLLYRNSATWVVLAAGTTGKILQTQGSGANPQWVGGKVLLNTLSPNGVASIADTSSMTNAFGAYEVSFDQVTPASTTFLLMQVATSGSNFISTSYISILYEDRSGTTSIFPFTTAVLVCDNVASGVGGGYSGIVRISNPANTSAPKNITGFGSNASAAGTAQLAMARCASYWNGGNNAITGINILPASGNIATGTIKVWGLL